ncbi:lasso peptide biosynthesis B2 protein [Sphingomonas faeni]|uniref:lasso peptide biosynthesis B2 protein n=1 Tax=Sphingomonas faeni TaxID=185950 RepID=UPI00278B904C|nr:hypothetical protein [Sphingomonas faeni]
MITIVDVAGDIVMMDAETDAYLCIGRNSLPQNGANGRAAPDRGQQVSDVLAAAGLARDRWRWADPAPLWVRQDLDRLDVSARRTLAAVPRMIIAGLATWLRLRGPVSSYRRWTVRSRECDPALVASIVSAFDALRPFVPRLGRCLPNSLFMRDFLALYGIPSTLIFGVRTHPFEAHCWIEHDGAVLNDTADHVAWFTPIYSC